MEKHNKPNLHIRSATLSHGDDIRILEFFNSQIPWLRSIGSGDQWKSELIPNGETHQKVQMWLTQSEQTETHNRPFGDEWYRAWIAEVHTSDPSKLSLEQTRLCQNGRIPVAALVLTGKSSGYTRPVIPQQDGLDPFTFLQLLISDRRVGELGRGAGAALVEFGKEETRKVGVGRMVGDCFGGNGGRLVRFYESCGFEVIGECVTGEQNWPVCCFGMRV